MDAVAAWWPSSDGVGRGVGLLLLAMSIATWALIVWKTWLLRRARHDLGRGVALFWAAPSLEVARQRLAVADREQLLLPLVDAALAAPAGDALEARAASAARLTRRLRGALHRGVATLQHGQVVLASIGATAPFVGLFGTVWGIYHALLAIAASGTVTIDKVAGPVGEALLMTAAGLAVAIPAVLAYNVHGRRVAACEAELEGFAHDLRELLGGGDDERR